MALRAAKVWVADREVELDLPSGYSPRSTLLPPPPSSLQDEPSWPASAPLTPFVDALGHSFEMEMDWSDRANDDVAVYESARLPIAASWDPDRPTKPSAAW